MNGNELIDDIKDLGQIVFSKDINNNAWSIHQTSDIQYQMNLEYLSQICIQLSEKYNGEFVG